MFTWNPDIGQFIADRHKAVPESSVRDAFEKVLNRSKQRLDQLAEQLKADRITVQQFEARAGREIKYINTVAAASAHGGFSQIRNQPDVQAGVETRVEEQRKYLNRFATQIASGEQKLNGQVNSRARSYAMSSYATYTAERTKQRDAVAEQKGKILMVRRVHGAVKTEHCPECRRLVEYGWMRADDPRFEPIGAQRCRGNCRCRLEYRYDPLPPGESPAQPAQSAPSASVVPPAVLSDVSSFDADEVNNYFKGFYTKARTAEDFAVKAPAGMTADEFNSIDNYTVAGYQIANKNTPFERRLKTDEDRAMAEQYRRNLDQSLAKLPGYAGTVYRGEYDTDGATLSRFRSLVGQSVQIENFLSTSKKEDKARSFGNDVFYEIQTRDAAKDLGFLDSEKDMVEEREVLINRNASFVVEKVEGNRVFLREVSSDAAREFVASALAEPAPKTEINAANKIANIPALLPESAPAQKSSPLRYTGDYKVHSKVSDADLKEIFGRKITAQEVGEFVAAPDGATVSILPVPGDTAIKVSLLHPDFIEGGAVRTIYRTSDGELRMVNDLLVLQEKAKGKNIGYQLLQRQIEKASAAGIDYLELTAERNDDPKDPMIGYLVWAKYGFDGKIKTQRLRLEKRFQDCRTIQELLSRPGGAEEWKEKGWTFNGIFDLKPGSRSREIFEAYARRKGL